MKKFFKQLFTFAMVMAILVSGSTVAMAAENNANTTEMATVPDVTPFDTDINTSISNYSDTGIMLCQTTLLSESHTGIAMNNSYTVTRTMSKDGYLVVKLDVTGSANIKVQLQSGLYTATLYEDSVTNGISWKISNSVVKEGWRVKITVTSLKNDTDYSLSAWIE